MKYLFFILMAATVAITTNGQPELKRKVRPGFTLQKLSNVPGAAVTSVESSSPAEKSGLVKGDIVLAINDGLITDDYAMQKLLQTVKAGDKIKLKIKRNSNFVSQAIIFEPLPAPLETFSQVTLESITLANDYGDWLRAFVTKPKNVRGKLPTILFVSWLSCSTIETTDLSDTWSLMLRDVVEKTGALVLRLEKPGVGDSEGMPCSECDLDREMNGYQVALRYLKSRSDVDTTNLIIFGGSIGGTLGPLVGKNHHVKAYVTSVSVYKTWLEHMIELERRRLFLSGKSHAETTDLMPGYIDFHSEYLVQGKTPEEVIKDKPEWRGLWYDDNAHQYGRPASFYHQVQQQNFFRNWQAVNVPVLIVAGEYDWIMSLEDGQLLQNMINSKHKGNATLLIGAGMNHHWSKFNTPLEAFNEENGTYTSETVASMIAWMKQVFAK